MDTLNGLDRYRSGDGRNGTRSAPPKNHGDSALAEMRDLRRIRPSMKTATGSCCVATAKLRRGVSVGSRRALPLRGEAQIVALRYVWRSDGFMMPVVKGPVRFACWE